MNSGDFLWDVDRIDWTQEWTATGSGSALPDVLRLLQSVESLDSGWDAYWQLDNVVVVQNTLYPAAETVIPFVMRIAAFVGGLPSRFALELLIQIASSESDPSSLLEADVMLGARCRTVVQHGLEFYYGLVGSPDPAIRSRALVLLDMIDTNGRRMSWTLDCLERDEQDPEVLETMRSIRRGWQADR